METSIDWGPLIFVSLSIGYAIWWKIKVDLPKKKKEKEKEKEEEKRLILEAEYKTSIKKNEIDSNETLLELCTILESVWVKTTGMTEEDREYIELTPEIIQEIQLKECIDILINQHQSFTENTYVGLRDFIGNYLDSYKYGNWDEYTLIRNILREINFLNEKDEVVITSYQELEECISKLSIKVKKDKENIRSLLSKELKDLDKNNTGSLDIFKEDTFNLLLNKNQKEIILLEKDFKKEFTKEFVKLSNFITTNKEGIIKQYELLKKINQKDILEENIGLLKNQINVYNTIQYLAIAMVTTLINGDKIKFYKIYETFDELNVFNSKWEKDLKKELEEINLNLLVVIDSIHQMSYKITTVLSSINTSIGDLSTTINKQLSSINSSVDLNTIITGINTYQLYKINKNTKSLN
jgi:hypothetical protein